MWEIFSNTCLCQHLLKSDMSDAVKDNTQNALMTVTIPPVVLNLSTKPKSSNKIKLYIQEAITHPQWTIIFLNKEGAIFLSSWLVMSETWASKPLVWSKLLGYGPLFSKHGRTNIDSCTTFKWLQENDSILGRGAESSSQNLLHTKVIMQVTTLWITNGFRAGVKVVQFSPLLSSEISLMSCMVTTLYSELCSLARKQN